MKQKPLNTQQKEPTQNTVFLLNLVDSKTNKKIRKM